MDYDNLDELCSTCPKVDFQRLFIETTGVLFNVNENIFGAYLGMIAHLVKSQDCPLCRLVLKGLYPSQKPEEIDLSTDGFIFKLRCYLYPVSAVEYIQPELEQLQPQMPNIILVFVKNDHLRLPPYEYHAVDADGRGFGREPLCYLAQCIANGQPRT